MAHIAVVGAGYVGLSAAACLAELGHEVVTTDNNGALVDSLQSGAVRIHEPDLPELVSRGLRTGKLRFTVNSSHAVAAAEFVILCLPTPTTNDGSADISALVHFVVSHSKAFSTGSVVITKSTVPVGTNRKLAALLARPEVKFASNPEFVREGSTVDDFMRPDRILIGADSAETGAAVSSLYQSIDAPIMVTTVETAELVKYVSNAFLATKVSFANALTELCESYQVDIIEVLKVVGLDRRIGGEYLRPGPGWGGSCLPKDVDALLAMARGQGVSLGLIDAARKENQLHQARVTEQILGQLPQRRGVVHVLGMAFKAGTDDVRDSPAVVITASLLKAGVEVQFFDPAAKNVPIEVRTARALQHSLDDVYKADVIALFTDWSEFREIDPERLATETQCRVIVDTRNALDKQKWKAAGFTYLGIGR
jgi:UDPglucose 6-dehydrogenase